MCLTEKPCAARTKQRSGSRALGPNMLPIGLDSYLGKERERQRREIRSVGTGVRVSSG